MANNSTVGNITYISGNIGNANAQTVRVSGLLSASGVALTFNSITSNVAGNSLTVHGNLRTNSVTTEILTGNVGNLSILNTGNLFANSISVGQSFVISNFANAFIISSQTTNASVITANISGNIRVTNTLEANVVNSDSANIIIKNVSTSGNVSNTFTTGNLTVTNAVFRSGITGNNIEVVGNVNCDGNTTVTTLSYGNLITSVYNTRNIFGNITANTVNITNSNIGNVVTSNINANSLIITNLIPTVDITANVLRASQVNTGWFYGNATCNVLSMSNSVSINTLLSAEVFTSETINANANVSVATINSLGNTVAISRPSFLGNANIRLVISNVITIGNLTANTLVGDSFTATGIVNAINSNSQSDSIATNVTGNIIIRGNLILASSASAQSNASVFNPTNLISLNANSLSSLTATNVSANNVVISNTWQVSNLIVSNISAPNVTANSFQAISMTGRYYRPGISIERAGNLIVSNSLTSTANILQVLTSNTGQVNITNTMFGNISMSNIIVTGVVVTGNLTMGNVIANAVTTSVSTITGNATFGNLTVTDAVIIRGNITANNISTGSYIYGNGAFITGNLTSSGNANISIATRMFGTNSAINVAGTFTGVGNTNTTNATIANLTTNTLLSIGNLSTTGNFTVNSLSVGNLFANGSTIQLSNLANIQVSNLIYSGNVVVSNLSANTLSYVQNIGTSTQLQSGTMNVNNILSAGRFRLSISSTAPVFAGWTMGRVSLSGQSLRTNSGNPRTITFTTPLPAGYSYGIQLSVYSTVFGQTMALFNITVVSLTNTSVQFYIWNNPGGSGDSNTYIGYFAYAY